MKQEGVEANVIAYNALIGVCQKSDQPERAFEILTTMHQEGELPNLVTHNALISACEKG